MINIGSLKSSFLYKGKDLIYPNPIKDGLILWYDFASMKNDSANKSIAKNMINIDNDGKLNNFAFNSESGYSNNNLNFDGIDDKIIVDGSDGRFMLDNLTVEWTGKMNATENSGTNHIIYCGYYMGWSLTYHDSNQLMLCMKNSLKEDGWNRNYLSRNVFEVGSEAFHFTAVFSPNGIKCYINGDYKENGSNTTEIKPQYEKMFDIEIMNDLEGSLMSTRIYNRTLTEEEIKHNYQLEKERWGL
ncbi:hypothetical protein CPT_Machias_158 [Staphylococcus phage Machias]|nr:hypothetical protein CPT_Machias_158 [Staphylococcus phage Machias]